MAVKWSWKFLLFFFSLEMFDVYAHTSHLRNASIDPIKDRDHFRYWSSKSGSIQLQHIESSTSTPRPWPITSCKDQHILLTFSNMGLKRIGDDFVRSEAPCTVLLDKNEIEDVSQVAFRSLQKLEMLDLSGNKIPVSKLLYHANCPSLKTLILNDNKADRNNEPYIPKGMEILPALKVLSLQGNGIVRLNVAFQDFAPRLNKLYLSRNYINASDFLENLPKYLTHLYLEDNAIRRVERGVASSLWELAIDGNKIEQLCADSCSDASLSLEGATSLETLRVSRNLIENIAEKTFDRTPMLNYLDLTHNQIRVVPNNTFKGLRKLQHLHLGYNLLISIPDLCSLGELRSLNLTGNDIVGVHRNSFCTLHFLQSLILSANRIRTIESGAFDNMNSLETLDLSGNVLKEFPPNWLRPKIPLRCLLLKNNSITNVDKLQISNIITLTDLHLERNPLVEVRIGSIYYYPHGLSIHFKEKRPGGLPLDRHNYGDYNYNGEDNDIDVDSDSDSDGDDYSNE